MTETEVDELRARHQRAPLPAVELDALPLHDLRVLALDEALYGRDRIPDPLPPACAAFLRRPGPRRW